MKSIMRAKRYRNYRLSPQGFTLQMVVMFFVTSRPIAIPENGLL